MVQTRLKCKDLNFDINPREYEVVIGNNTKDGDPDVFAVGLIIDKHETQWYHLRYSDIREIIKQHQQNCIKNKCCPICGTLMEEVVDSRAKKKTGYSWRCPKKCFGDAIINMG